MAQFASIRTFDTLCEHHLTVRPQKEPEHSYLDEMDSQKATG